MSFQPKSCCSVVSRTPSNWRSIEFLVTPKRRRAQITQRKLPTCVEAEAAAGSPACTERRLDEGARALGGGIGGAGSIWSKVTIETGWSSVKPEKLNAYGEELVQEKRPLAALGAGSR